MGAFREGLKSEAGPLPKPLRVGIRVGMVKKQQVYILIDDGQTIAG